MNATEFKAKCLNTLDNVPASGLIITKHGKSIAVLIPYREGTGIIGKLQGKIKIKGDILETGIKWNAES